VVLNQRPLPVLVSGSNSHDESLDRDTEAFAASLLRIKPCTPIEQFFRDSGRTLMEAIFTVMTERTDAKAIRRFLDLPRAHIQKGLKGIRTYPLIDPGAHEQGSGILATAANALKPVSSSPVGGSSSAHMGRSRMGAEAQALGVSLLQTGHEGRDSAAAGRLARQPRALVDEC
jgi:hypothetical protein